MSVCRWMETSKYQKTCFALNPFLIQNLISFLQFRALHFHAFMHKHDQFYVVMIINRKNGFEMFRTHDVHNKYTMMLTCT